MTQETEIQNSQEETKNDIEPQEKGEEQSENNKPQEKEKKRRTKKQGNSQNPPKKKVGRPKTKDVKKTCKNINVAIPITLLDKWEEIKIVHGNNLTEYITKLIKKDMDTNYKKYKELTDSLKNI